MLTKLERELMNTPVFRGSACIGYCREVIRSEVAELVLESVHPANLGALPPSPELLIFKAIQIGIISSYREGVVAVRKGQFN